MHKNRVYSKLYNQNILCKYNKNSVTEDGRFWRFLFLLDFINSANSSQILHLTESIPEITLIRTEQNRSRMHNTA